MSERTENAAAALKAGSQLYDDAACLDDKDPNRKILLEQADTVTRFASIQASIAQAEACERIADRLDAMDQIDRRR